MSEITEPSNARSRRTLEALLDSTRALLEEEGFDALTMNAVADRAGVSRRAVYLHFQSRAELISRTFEHIAATEDLEGSVAPVWDAPDARTALERWARHLADYHPRVMAVDRAIQRVGGDDEAAAVLRRRVTRAQRASCKRIALWLQRDGVLAPGWTAKSAGDLLFAMISTDMLERMLDDCGWSQQQVADRLSLLLCSALAP